MTKRPHRPVRRPRRPAKRLLIAPVVLLGAIIAAVVAVPTAGDRPQTVVTEVAGVPPAVVDPEPCQRGRREPDVAPFTAALAAQGRVTSAMVTACPAAFDGRRVTYAGELVGDLLHREGGAWVLVNDDDYALVNGPLPVHREYRGTNSGLSVWLPDEVLDQVTGLGRPNQRGDVVVVGGHVQRTDPDDGGGLTVRADALTVLQAAEAVHEPLDRPQALFALVCVLAGAAMWTVRRRAGR